MRRGKMSTSTAGTLWVDASCVFVKKTPPWWQFWKRPSWVYREGIKDWLWGAGSHLQLVLAWMGDKEDVAVDSSLDPTDYFFEVREFRTAGEALSSFRASNQSVEFIVADRNRLVDHRTVLFDWSGSRYRRSNSKWT